MTEEEKVEIAIDIAQDLVESCFFSDVYEHDALEDVDESEIVEIHDIVLSRLKVVQK